VRADMSIRALGDVRFRPRDFKNPCIESQAFIRFQLLPFCNGFFSWKFIQIRISDKKNRACTAVGLSLLNQSKAQLLVDRDFPSTTGYQRNNSFLKNPSKDEQSQLNRAGLGNVEHGQKENNSSPRVAVHADSPLW
jgi:hypothetical protein